MKNILFILNFLVFFTNNFSAELNEYSDQESYISDEENDSNLSEKYKSFVIQFDNFHDFNNFINIGCSIRPSGHISHFNENSLMIEFNLDEPISINQINNMNIYEWLSRYDINAPHGVIWQY